jgi:hypothetical protein
MRSRRGVVRSAHENTKAAFKFRRARLRALVAIVTISQSGVDRLKFVALAPEEARE